METIGRRNCPGSPYIIIRDLLLLSMEREKQENGNLEYLSRALLAVEQHAKREIYDRRWDCYPVNYHVGGEVAG